MTNLEKLNLLTYCENINKMINIKYQLVDLEFVESPDIVGYNCSGCSVDKDRCVAYHRCGLKHGAKNFGSNLYECANKKHFLAMDFYSRSEPFACLILGPLTIVSEQARYDRGQITIAKLNAVRDYTSDFIKLYNTSSYATHFFNISYDETPSVDLVPKVESYSRYPLAMERLIENRIASGSTDEAIELVHNLINEIYAMTDRDIHEVRSRASEIILVISRASMNAGNDIPKCFAKNDACLKSLRKANSLNVVMDILTEAIPYYTNISLNLMSIKHPDIIMKATEYIKKNFSDKITLIDVADNCSISTSYLSKLLKEELGSTFTEYTNSIRIEKSKQMLIETDDRIQDIAVVCGFEDQSYFTKVFKKTTGVNPCKYRDNRGKIEFLTIA